MRARPGLHAWLVQRLSAVYMLVFIVAVLGRLLLDPPRSYDAWHGWVAGRVFAVALLVFFAALIGHAWVGLRDVMIDYVRPVAWRSLSLGLLGLCLTALAAWVLVILWASS